MIKSEKFSISKKHYAFDPNSISVGDGPLYSQASIETQPDLAEVRWISVQCFYYKKKDDKIMACFGRVRWLARPPFTYERFIEGKYEGDPYAQWDGTNFIGTSVYADIVDFVKELDPILKSYPAIPDGYDGWYKNT